MQKFEKKKDKNLHNSIFFCTFALELIEGTRKGSLILVKYRYIFVMIDATELRTFLTATLAEGGYELITLTISATDEILVEIDRLSGVDVDYCAVLNHAVCEHLDALYGADYDYSLEVGSVSLTDPFKTHMQYEKNLGNDVEVLASDGKKYRGQLVSVDEESFSVDVEEKVQEEGKKRPVKKLVTHTWGYSDVKYTRYDLKF